MSDLSTSYLGLALRNPLVASASPLSEGVDRVRALADSGVGAVVMYSLFEEEVHREQLRDLMVSEAHEDAFGEALSYFPNVPSAGTGGATRASTGAPPAVGWGSRARCRMPVPPRSS